MGRSPGPAEGRATVQCSANDGQCTTVTEYKVLAKPVTMKQ